MSDTRAAAMAPRERVMRTFDREIPDRVPVNYFGNAGINARMMAHFGLSDGDYEGLLKAIGVDFRGVAPPYTGPRLHPEIPGMMVDPQWGVCTRWVQHDTGGYWDYCHFQLKDADEEAIANWPMPSPDDYDYEAVKAQSRVYEGFAIYAGGAGLVDIINATGRMRTMEQTLVDLITDDPAGLLLIDRRLDIEFETTVRTIEAAGGRVDFLWLGEDLGAQNAPIISLDLFRKHIRLRHQRYIDMAKSFGLPVMMHSCGSSSWAYNDFIEMGVNAVDTLQPEAANMSPEYLKNTFGHRLAFHGCISTAGPVAFGSVEDVVENCRCTLEVMMPGGGYCFAPTHALQDNSPTENVVAMYEAASKYGRY